MTNKRTDFFVEDYDSNQQEDLNLNLNLSNDLDVGLDDNELLGDLNIDLGMDETVKETVNTEASLNLDLNLNVVSNNEVNNKELEELKLKTDKDRLNSILDRYYAYTTKQDIIKGRTAKVRALSNKLSEIVLKSLEDLIYTVTPDLQNKMNSAFKKLRTFLLQDVTIDSDDDLNVEQLLISLGFPQEVLIVGGNALKQQLEPEIKGLYLGIKELNKQNLSTMSIINPQISDTALTEGVYLRDVKEIKYNNLSGEQTVTCPVCGAVTQFEMLKFNKSYDELLSKRNHYLFAVAPFLCDKCSSILVLNDNTIQTLDDELKKQFTSESMTILNTNYSDESENTHIDRSRMRNIFKPSEQVLALIPEIIIENAIADTVIVDQVKDVELNSLRDYFESVDKQELLYELKIVLDKDKYKDLRHNIFLYNGILKTEYNLANVSDIILGTVSQIPLIKTLVNIKRNLIALDSNIISLSKILKALEYLIKDRVENDESGGLCFERSSVIDFINKAFVSLSISDAVLSRTVTTETNTKILQIIHQSIDTELNKVLNQKKDLESALKDGKKFIFEHPLEIFIMPTIFANTIQYTQNVFSIFDTPEETEEFLNLAKVFISLNCWYKYILNDYRGRFSRSRKPFKMHETSKSLKSTMAFLDSTTNSDLDISSTTGLINLNLGSLKSCLGEVPKPNSKYRFIHRVIRLFNCPTTTIQVTRVMDKLKNLVDNDYKQKYEQFDIDKFNLYYILKDLGFNPEEVFEYITKYDTSTIDTSSIAVVKHGITLEEYIKEYNNLPHYTGDVIRYDNLTYNILFILRTLEEFEKDRAFNVHTDIKSNLMNYTVNCILNTTTLLDRCEVVDDNQINTNIDYEYGYVSYLKGMKYVKILFDQVEPISIHLAQIYDEDASSDTIKLLSKGQMDFPAIDIIKTTLFENDLSLISNIDFDLAMLVTLGREVFPQIVPADIEAIISRDDLTIVEIYTLVYTDDIFDNNIIKKYTSIDKEKLRKHFKMSFESYKEKLKSKLPITAQFKMDKYWGDLNVQ